MPHVPVGCSGALPELCCPPVPVPLPRLCVRVFACRFAAPEAWTAYGDRLIAAAVRDAVAASFPLQGSLQDERECGRAAEACWRRGQQPAASLVQQSVSAARCGWGRTPPVGPGAPPLPGDLAPSLPSSAAATLRPVPPSLPGSSSFPPTQSKPICPPLPCASLALLAGRFENMVVPLHNPN